MEIIHRYGLVLNHRPSRAEMTFMHYSPRLGTQIWDSQLWPLSPDIKTERAYLGELYEACLLFMERRA